MQRDGGVRRGGMWLVVSLAAGLAAACGSSPPPPTPLPQPTLVPAPTVPRPALDTPVAGGSGPSGPSGPAGQGVQVRHTVRPGETLGTIAQQYYGNANRWQPIYEANRNVLSSPDALQAGMTLVIPPQ